MIAHLDRRVLRASLSTSGLALGMGSKLVAALVVTRLLTGHVDPERYGLIVTITGVASWLLVIDLGLVPVIKNRLIAGLALGEAGRRIEGLVRTGMVLSAISSLLGTFVLLMAWFLLPIGGLFGTTESVNDALASGLLFTLGVVLLWTLPAIIPRAVYGAHQSEYRLVFSTVAGSALSILMTWLAIIWDAPIVIVATAPVLGLAIGNWLSVIQMVVDFPSVRHPPLERGLARALLKEGLPFLIIQVSCIFIYQTGTFIANRVIGHVEAGQFAIHLMLFSYVGVLCNMVVQPYWSALGDARERGDRIWVKKALTRLSIMIGIGALLSTSALLVTGPWLITQISSGQFAWDSSMAAVMGLSLLITSVMNIYAVYLGSAGITRGWWVVTVIQAFLTIALCTLFASWWGLLGIAVGSFLSYIATSGWYVPYLLRRTLARS